MGFGGALGFGAFGCVMAFGAFGGPLTFVGVGGLYFGIDLTPFDFGGALVVVNAASRYRSATRLAELLTLCFATSSTEACL